MSDRVIKQMGEGKKYDLQYRFEFYLEQVGLDPAKVPPKVLREIQLAFFAGMASIFILMVEVDGVDDDTAVNNLNRIDEQLRAFILQYNQP